MDYSDKLILDREILKENTMDSVPLQAELFVLFFDQSTVYMAQLAEALSTGNATDWRMTAHGVKGASRSLGFTRLATAAMDAEKMSPSAERLEQLRTILAQTREAVWPKENAA